MLPGGDRSIRLIAGGATMLAASVLADSGIEHYRGSFHNPAMVLPLAASAASLVGNGWRAAIPHGGDLRAPMLIHATAVGVGMAGLGFHAYNLAKQPGRLRFGALLYAAPIGAPGALILAGIVGAAADALCHAAGDGGSERLIAGVIAGGIAGSAGEAALLHFRGAYHNPAMWLPVSIPPLAALSLARDALECRVRGHTTLLLAITAGLGLMGAAFHIYGVARNMGGWRNWRQNLLAGPPIPAPPAFTALAIAGLGAQSLMADHRHG